MIKVVVFDWNGVITDSLDLDHSIFLEECKKAGIDVPQDMDFYRELYNGNIFENLIKLGFTPEYFEDEKEYKETYMKNIGKAPIFAGMREVLLQLRRRHKLAIVTSNYREPVDMFNELNGLNGIFDVILTAEDSKRKEDSIRRLLKEFNVSTDEIVFVGDTISDIMACKKLGVKILAATWGYHNKKELLDHEPDFVAESLSDMVNTIKQLEESL